MRQAVSSLRYGGNPGLLMYAAGPGQPPLHIATVPQQLLTFQSRSAKGKHVLIPSAITERLEYSLHRRYSDVDKCAASFTFQEVTKQYFSQQR